MTPIPESPTSPGADEAPIPIDKDIVAAQILDNLIDDVIKSDTNEPSVG